MEKDSEEVTGLVEQIATMGEGFRRRHIELTRDSIKLGNLLEELKAKVPREWKRWYEANERLKATVGTFRNAEYHMALAKAVRTDFELQFMGLHEARLKAGIIKPKKEKEFPGEPIPGKSTYPGPTTPVANPDPPAEPFDPTTPGPLGTDLNMAQMVGLGVSVAAEPPQDWDVMIDAQLMAQVLGRVVVTSNTLDRIDPARGIMRIDGSPGHGVLFRTVGLGLTTEQYLAEGELVKVRRQFQAVVHAEPMLAAAKRSKGATYLKYDAKENLSAEELSGEILRAFADICEASTNAEIDDKGIRTLPIRPDFYRRLMRIERAFNRLDLDVSVNATDPDPPPKTK